MDNKLRVTICASSLYVGCVELVVHFGAPVSVQDFLQETGRAAREPGSEGQSILMTYMRQTWAGTNQYLRDYASSKCTERGTVLILQSLVMCLIVHQVPHQCKHASLSWLVKHWKRRQFVLQKILVIYRAFHKTVTFRGQGSHVLVVVVWQHEEHSEVNTMIRNLGLFCSILSIFAMILLII